MPEKTRPRGNGAKSGGSVEVGETAATVIVRGSGARYGTSSIGRKRRSSDDVENLRRNLADIVRENHPVTVRQVFYQAVAKGLVDKSESEYRGTVCRLLADMRRDCTIPYSYIADNTRWQRKPATYDSLNEFLELSARLYRRSLWTNQDAHIEVWLEKDALAGVIYEVTSRFDVPLMVTRGYSSLSFLHAAASDIAENPRDTFIYCIGDRDPSGRDIARNVEEQLKELSGRDIAFDLLAVTDEQVRDLGLLTRPTKKSDTRAKGFKGESVEVDAIPPGMLRNLVWQAIRQHIDMAAYNKTLIAERSERDIMKRIAQGGVK